MGGYRDILVGLDFSEATEEVCERAVALARCWEGGPMVVDPVSFYTMTSAHLTY